MIILEFKGVRYQLDQVPQMVAAVKQHVLGELTGSSEADLRDDYSELIARAVVFGFALSARGALHVQVAREAGNERTAKFIRDTVDAYHSTLTAPYGFSIEASEADADEADDAAPAAAEQVSA